MCGVRDLDAGERVLVETAGVGNARPSEVVAALRGERVYVHLDLDVLDPERPARAVRGPERAQRHRPAHAAGRAQARREIVGLEVTAFEAPEDDARARDPHRPGGVDRGGAAARMNDGLSDPRRLAALAESGLSTPRPRRPSTASRGSSPRRCTCPSRCSRSSPPQRQVFKSSVGVGELRETPLSHSFCRHVVDSGAPLEVVDARTHPKVRDNPAIEDYGIVSYLGMPLTTSDGVRLGALCAIDHEPRQWTGRDHGVLEDLAGAAMAEVELRRANRAVAAAAAELHFAATHDSAHAARQPPRAARRPRPAAGRASAPRPTRCWTSTGMRGVNDAHGHHTGDELLTRLASRLESALVGDGHVYRLGGVQLCALLMETGARGGRARSRPPAAR